MKKAVLESLEFSEMNPHKGEERIKEIMVENMGFTEINPLICGEERCEAGHAFGPAKRSYYLLHYVYSGKGVFKNSTGTYNVNAGELFVIRPEEDTWYQADQADPWFYGWIGFESRTPLEKILTESVIKVAAKHIFSSLVACRLEAGKEWFICGKIYELLAILHKDNGEGSHSYQHVKMAENYIEAHYMQEIRVGQLAHNLGLDRSYFSKIFRAGTGKAPQQYIVGYRLKKAAELLLTQNLTVGEVATQVGYTDLFNFSRMFSRHYGVPPSKYGKKTNI